MSSPIPKPRRGILRVFPAAIVLSILSVLTLPPAMAAEASTVRVKDGHIQEYVNGSLRRSYGSDIVNVSTDGEIVAAVTKQGHIQEYANGSLRRSYGSDIVRETKESARAYLVRAGIITRNGNLAKPYRAI